MVLSDLVLSYQEHGGDANAGEESGRALLSALQRVSRDHVRDCFSGENGSGEAEMMVRSCLNVIYMYVMYSVHSRPPTSVSRPRSRRKQLCSDG